jgi:DNA-binding CsgD family transcriptional regulator
VKVYLEECGGVDPFSMRWKAKREAGIFTLATLRDDSVEYLLYTKLFLPAAGVEDELGVVFPVTGHNSFAFFLEREHGQFTRAEVERAKLLYPALESFHRSHLGWLFNELRYTDRPEVTGLINRPTLIRDRSGQLVYANGSWNELTERHPSILSRIDAMADGAADEIASDSFTLKSEALGVDFPLAPGGRMFVLEPRPAARTDRLGGVSNVLQIFTPRERDILDLIMQGCDSAKISERLRIGVGSVKNCKMRIYRKADVATERALVKKFVPIYEPSPQ